MVLEHLYPLKLIKNKPFYAFLLGIAYSVIGIGAALLLFPEDPAIVSVAFISLMIYPTLNTLLKQEEKIESRKNEFNLFLFFRDHRDIFKIYVFLFLGILLGFSFFSLILPSLATNHIFENQINVLYGRATGQAITSRGLFRDILNNNMGVLILCFITAFMFGDGAIFLITWNASVWGTIFGNIAKTAALNVSASPVNYFITILIIVFPHMILEAFSYISAATAGGVISKGVLKEKFFSKRYHHILTNTAILLVFALIVLVIAVIIETYVLSSSTVYKQIIAESFL